MYSKGFVFNGYLSLLVCFEEIVFSDRLISINNFDFNLNSQFIVFLLQFFGCSVGDLIKKKRIKEEIVVLKNEVKVSILYCKYFLFDSYRKCCRI